jgi:predicted permease
MELFVRILEVIFPVIAVVAAGVWAGRKNKPEMAVANRLNMDCFTPAMVFTVMAGGDFHIREYVWLAAAAAISIFACGLIGYLTARGLREAPKTVGLPIMINNSGNLGIPLALLAFGQRGDGRCRCAIPCIEHDSFHNWPVDSGSQRQNA